MHLSAPGDALRRLGGAVLDALLPPHCLTCDSPVEAQGTLCAGCFGGLHALTAPLCRHCGVPFLHAGQAGPGGACPACLARPPAFATARAALRYDEGAKRLLLPFKHADRTELAAPLAARMARAGAALLARAEVVAPVPLHWRRLLSRRYNQAALLAGVLAREAGRPHIPDLLRRTRPTPALGDRGREERAALLDGAFALGRAAPAIAGRRVLLVDDVMTSGATADACARALLAAGAAAVDVLAAARVPDPRLERA